MRRDGGVDDGEGERMEGKKGRGGRGDAGVRGWGVML